MDVYVRTKSGLAKVASPLFAFYWNRLLSGQLRAVLRVDDRDQVVGDQEVRRCVRVHSVEREERSEGGRGAGQVREGRNLTGCLLGSQQDIRVVVREPDRRGLPL